MKTEIGPKELELRGLLQEFASVRIQLADLGEELIETKKDLERYKNDHSLLQAVISSLEPVMIIYREKDANHLLFQTLEQYRKNKQV